MQPVIVERDGPVLRIRLNRPEVLNALTSDMHDMLEGAFDMLAADRDLKIGVVTGTGRAFCVGSDLGDLGENGLVRRPYPPHGYAGLIERFDLHKPLIAAVNGMAIGGGFEIALACDIIVTADTAQFGLLETRVGALASGGGIHRLVRQIGLKPAMGMLLACRRIDAREALQLGLVNEVVAADELDAAVDRWCGEILKSAPSAVEATKEAVLAGANLVSLAEALKTQAALPTWVKHMESGNREEGRAAFLEKRPPRWLD